MLGTIDSNQYWEWAAYGKHPVSGDYFRLGAAFPLGKGFSDWVERSYPLVQSPRSLSFNAYSWRFWSKGPEREHLTCGLVRDTMDRVGRPYAILILGYGSLSDWEGHWDLIPWACERTWSQMEHISTRMFRDLKQLEDEIRAINPPKADWSEFGRFNEEVVDDPSGQRIPDEIRISPSEFIQNIKESEAFLDLNQKPTKDYPRLIHLCHKAIKDQRKEVPKTVFMGGNSLKTYLAIFRRPLGTEDFLRLWSVGSEGDQKLAE